MDNATHEPDKSPLAEQYDRFVATSLEFFRAGRDMGHEALNLAMDKTREQMTALGELSTEQAASFKEYMKRDLEHTAEDMNRLGESAKDRLNPARMGAGALSSLASLLQTGADSLRQLSRQASPLRVYKEGEVTSAGTLICTTCKHEEHFAESGAVPLCPNCRGITFEKNG